MRTWETLPSHQPLLLRHRALRSNIAAAAQFWRRICSHNYWIFLGASLRYAKEEKKKLLQEPRFINAAVMCRCGDKNRRNNRKRRPDTPLQRDAWLLPRELRLTTSS